MAVAPFNNAVYFVPNAISTSAFNSRDAATLAAGAVFQGVGEDVSAYGRAGIAIHSTNSSDGVLTVEVSHDNITWFGPPREWADTQFATPHMWNIVERYFRIKYTNGTTEATALSIQVQYSNNSDIVLGHELNSILPAETEAQAMRPTNDFRVDTARVHILGQSAEFFFGHNLAVGTAYEDVWPNGGDYPWQSTTAGKIEIISTHAADNGTTPGLGCQSVEVHGLSATGADQSEVILTNGVTAVQSTLDYIRVNLLHNETVGTYGGSHQGDISAQKTGGGTVLSIMTGDDTAGVGYGYGEAQNGFTSIPLGKVAYITRLQVNPNNLGTNKHVSVALMERENILDVTTPFGPRRVLWSEEEFTEPIIKVFESHIKIKALADVWFRAKGSAASKIAVSCDYYLLDEDANGA